MRPGNEGLSKVRLCWRGNEGMRRRWSGEVYERLKRRLIRVNEG